ncbi:MAG: hypothetical protein ACMUIA_10475 [bacterium]
MNGVALLFTVGFWSLVFFRHMVPLPSELPSLIERSQAATTYGFMIADLLWSVPLLFLATLGLWRLRPWGWTAAQMVHALWLFSMTVIFVRDNYTAWSPGFVLFLVFPFISVWATLYLWRQRSLFWSKAAGDCMAGS